MACDVIMFEIKSAVYTRADFFLFIYHGVARTARQKKGVGSLRWFAINNSCSTHNDNLIQRTTTLRRTTHTRNLIVFDGKFVIVSDLLADFDFSFRIDDDLLLPLDENDFRVTIWLKETRIRMSIWFIPPPPRLCP